MYPKRCKVTQFILSENCSTCFGWYHRPSSGAQTTVSTVSGICHTGTATCRYRGRVGTDHPPSGAQTTVSTASGICHTDTATCRYRGRENVVLYTLEYYYDARTHER